MTQDKIYKLEDNPYSHFTICDNSGNENEIVNAVIICFLSEEIKWSNFKTFFFKNSCSVFEK